MSSTIDRCKGKSTAYFLPAVVASDYLIAVYTPMTGMQKNTPCLPHSHVPLRIDEYSFLLFATIVVNVAHILKIFHACLLSD